MLDNIKSLYFIRKILSYIKEKKKLELIIYNKNIQKNFDIDITNYKFFRGRYKIVDKNRKGQEFYGSNDVLAFEGEYKNGKRNGKGKEYNINGNLIFEGEYKNGKRNGKGKEYSTDGDLIFEGEYKNGKRNGKGKELCFNKYKEFEGEYRNGIRWIGVEYDYDENIINKINYEEELYKEYYKNELKKFEGESINGKKNGKGKEFFNNDNNKLMFEGYYLNNKKWNGKGYDINGNIIYELINGNCIVKGYHEVDLQIIYEGEYKNGKKNGKGKEYYYMDKILYEGEYLNGKRHGKGKQYYYIDGNLEFEGEYLYNSKKKGKEYYNAESKLMFEGEYLYQKKMEWKIIWY